MDVSSKEYKQMEKQSAPKSPVLKNAIWAFCVGGGLCALGEAITQIGLNNNFTEDNARFICTVCLVFLSVLFTGIGWYDNIAKHAGAGTLVPITGFANAIASPAIEFKSEGLVLGMAAKMFVIAGPVLTYGIAASVLYGIVLYIISLF